MIRTAVPPNAEHTWDLKSMTYTVRAIRPIAQGEQVFIAYHYLFLPRVERQNVLFSKYSFKCTCPCCTLPPAESTLSDIRRNLLKTLFAQTPEVLREQDRLLKEWASNPSLPDDHLTKRSQMVLALMDKEDAYDMNAWFAHCALLFKAFSALSDREGVQELAIKATTMAKIYTGSDGGWSKTAKAPEATEWWGLRRKITA